MAADRLERRLLLRFCKMVENTPIESGGTDFVELFIFFSPFNCAFRNSPFTTDYTDTMRRWSDGSQAFLEPFGT